MARIVATISGHGFGHLSISAPILNRIGGVIPDLQLTIVSALPEERVRLRVHVPFSYHYSTEDFGVSMKPDLSVNINDTAARYRHLHEDWESRVQDYAQRLETYGCDLLLSNISYLSLAAACNLGIPALALCSLNWADMYRYYCHGEPEFESIHRQMTAAYASAELFLAPQPSMPMNSRFNTRGVGPVAEIGCNRKTELQARLKIETSCRLMLVAMGGHDLQLPIDWPDRDDLLWLVPGSWRIHHARAVAIESLDIPFLDLLASCDLLIGKPGYGSFTEAACAGTPVLYIVRPDWPEQRYLIDWLQRNGRCWELDPGRLHSGAFMEDARMLVNGPPPGDRPRPTGIDETAETIRRLLGI